MLRKINCKNYNLPAENEIATIKKRGVNVDFFNFFHILISSL
jgi:hypothetical protein